ncbi:hypothetical protein KR093_007579, partial [Drosophila rubida]
MADSLLLGEAPPPLAEDMASSVIVELPSATVDAALGGGTLPAAAIHFADLTESGSESGDDPSTDAQEQHHQLNQQQQQQLETGSSSVNAARSSPPPNCAICLSRCRRKCFTDSCMHQFCFKCLCEWSKIKPECPLCKQPFKTIIHNVRTLDDYDRYPVQPSSPESSLSFHMVNIRRLRVTAADGIGISDGDDIDAAATDESQDGGASHVQQPSRGFFVPHNRLEPYRMELLNFYRHDQDARGAGSLSMLWRRYVYDRKLYALPVSDNLTGNFREWSARFYRDNPAQMHRLMPWINRDIVCLLRTSPQNVTQVMQMMNNILPMINIPTRTFRRRLSPFLGERTNHFIHELFNFARSPYDMIGYDRVVQYSALVAEEVEVDLLDLVSTNEGGSTLEPSANGGANSSGNASGESSGNGAGGGSENGLGNSEATTASGWSSRMPRPSTSVIVTNPSATHSFSVTMATDGSELPGISIRRTTTSNVGSQTVAINLSMRRPANEIIEIDDGDAAANAEVAAINDGNGSTTGRRQAGASLPISAHIELQSSDCSNSSDDDDECVFVLERKPPHLRTPELVSLDSNSDSDVVFVDEQKPSPPAKATNDEDSVSVSIDQAVANELFMGPSTSTGVCSTAGKNWMLVLEQARRQDPMFLRSRTKRNLARAQRAAPAAASTSSDGTRWNSSSDSSSSSSEESTAPAKRRKRRAARKPKPKAPKRPASSKPPATQQFKSKRRRKQAPEVEPEPEPEPEPEEQQEEEEREEAATKEERMASSSNSSSSSSSSSDDSSEEGAAGDSTDPAGKQRSSTQRYTLNNAPRCVLGNHNNNEDSSSSSSDDDFGPLRSYLRSTLEAMDPGGEDTKPPKKELDSAGEETELQQPAEEEEAASTVARAVVKRRRSNSSSNQSSSHSHSHSNSALSTLASHNTTMSSSSLRSLFNNNNNNNMHTGGDATDATAASASADRPLSMVATANSLLELSAMSVGGAGSGLFNEQSLGVDDAMRYLQNTLPSASDDAQLGIYSDASNELQHYPTEAEPEMAIDVVGEGVSSNAQGESADVGEANEIESENQRDEPDEEEQDDQDQEDEEEEEEEEENDEDYEDEDEAAADEATPDS